KTQNEVKHDIYKSVVNTKYSLLNNADRGEFYTYYNSDSEMMVNIISADLFAILFPLVHAIGYFIALFAINVIIGGLVSSLTVAIIFLNWVFINKFKQLEKETLAAREDFVRITDTAIRGKITVRQLQIGDAIAGRIVEKADGIYHMGKKGIRLNLYRKVTLEFLATICTSLITPIACILAATNSIELASTVMIAQICRFIIMQTNGLGTAVQQLSIHMVSYNRLQKVLQLPNEYEQKEEMDQIILTNEEKTAIVFSNFSVAYKNENWILNDVNAEIKSGEITALIGPSGSGKSSIVKALMGLIDYTGDIHIFGIEARRIKPKDLRSHIAYSPEHGQLFEENSILDNLLYVAPDKTDEEIFDVLHDLSLGDLDVNRNANTLSGGQRLRVALARALLKDSEIVILDEPTSALDSESESIVLQIMDTLKQRGKTVILISHRRSTIRNADKYLIISDTQLYQYDTYEDAMEKYEKLFSSQVKTSR
ncbi:MAG: ABC transporter ATP-binding protein, partial [Bianqueaceae bacterium]